MLCNEEFPELYSLLAIIEVINFRKMRLVGLALHMEEKW